jgi:hypothetical protein
VLVVVDAMLGVLFEGEGRMFGFAMLRSLGGGREIWSYK